MKNEFIARRFPRRIDSSGNEYIHWEYPHAVHGAGGALIEVGDEHGVTPEQMRAAFGPNTAGVYWTSDGVDLSMQLDEVIAIAHEHGVPVLVDASNTLPPAKNLHHFIVSEPSIAFPITSGDRTQQRSCISIPNRR